jgi:hypothetical protein
VFIIKNIHPHPGYFFRFFFCFSVFTKNNHPKRDLLIYLSARFSPENTLSINFTEEQQQKKRRKINVENPV